MQLLQEVDSYKQLTPPEAIFCASSYYNNKKKGGLGIPMVCNNKSLFSVTNIHS